MPERVSPYHGHRSPREVIAHAGRLSLRFALSFRDVEQPHQPTRPRERQLRRFESLPPAQCFLAAFGRFCNHFRPGRHLLAAAEAY